MIVIHYKNGEEKGHHKVAKEAVENHVKFYTEYGYTCEVINEADYTKRCIEEGREVVEL